MKWVICPVLSIGVPHYLQANNKCIILRYVTHILIFYAINCKTLPHGLEDRQVPLVMTVGWTYSPQTLYVAPNDAPEVDFLCMCGWDLACTWGNDRISMPLEELGTPQSAKRQSGS